MQEEAHDCQQTCWREEIEGHESLFYQVSFQTIQELVQSPVQNAFLHWKKIFVY